MPAAGAGGGGADGGASQPNMRCQNEGAAGGAGAAAGAGAAGAAGAEASAASASRKLAGGVGAGVLGNKFETAASSGFGTLRVSSNATLGSCLGVTSL